MTRLLQTFALSLLVACSADQPVLTATDVQIPAPIPGASMGAAYLSLHNNSDQAISITNVASPQMKSVEMHESVLEDGISRMFKLSQVTIAPQQSVVFERGSKHLMLRYPTDTPTQVTLQFFADDTLLLSVEADLKE
ncbi:MAG: copper chaperone PCu(A)C [Woeseiaceae bacterium]